MVGVVVRETSSDTPIATLSVTANSRKRRPTMPPISRIGMNTATSEVLMESTVNPISRRPRNRIYGALHEHLAGCGIHSYSADGRHRWPPLPRICGHAQRGYRGVAAGFPYHHSDHVRQVPAAPGAGTSRTRVPHRRITV